MKKQISLIYFSFCKWLNSPSLTIIFSYHIPETGFWIPVAPPSTMRIQGTHMFVVYIIVITSFLFARKKIVHVTNMCIFSSHFNGNFGITCKFLNF